MEESVELLESVDGPFKERDYCILMLFLNCGLRVSELCGLNISDIKENQIRVLGKGNKERMLYLNDACIDAINEYLPHRLTPNNDTGNAGALFISKKRNRIRKTSVEALVKKYIAKAGLDPSKYSAHKLRHTAATLMLRNGVDVRAVQEVLGHEHLNTTEIYTHIDNEDLRVAAKANPLSHIKKSKKANKETAE